MVSDSVDGSILLGDPDRGNPFTDQTYSQHGDITAIKVDSTSIILALQLQYGTVWADRHGKDGSEGEIIQFGYEEYLTGIQGVASSCAHKFILSVRRFYLLFMKNCRFRSLSSF